MTLRIHDVEVPVSEIPANIRVQITKKSLDARRKSRIVFHYQVDVDLEDEASVYQSKSTLVSVSEPTAPSDPLAGIDIAELNFRHKPVIIGSGPSGSFTALTLANAGQACIIVDRGEPVEERIKTTNRLRSRGLFDAESNYCFGEGGAGTFSDGKLTCGRNHPLIRHVFDQFVEYGAPDEILYDAKPHIGTDYLLKIAKNMRTHLVNQGSEFKFGRRFVDFRDGGDHAR